MQYRLVAGDLARHNELFAHFNPVRYLHVIWCYNAAADTLSTGAIETQSGQVMEDPVQLSELQ